MTTEQLSLPLIPLPDIPADTNASGRDVWFDRARNVWVSDPFDAWLSDDQLLKKYGPACGKVVSGR